MRVFTSYMETDAEMQARALGKRLSLVRDVGRKRQRRRDRKIVTSRSKVSRITADDRETPTQMDTRVRTHRFDVVREKDRT